MSVAHQPGRCKSGDLELASALWRDAARIGADTDATQGLRFGGALIDYERGELDAAAAALVEVQSGKSPYETSLGRAFLGALEMERGDPRAAFEDALKTAL